MEKIKLYFEGESIFSNLLEKNSHFKKSNYEDSDVIVSNNFSVGIYNKSDIQKKIDAYKNLNKLVLVFLISDNETKLKVYDNIILFRTSLRKSKKNKNEYILPYLWECFNENVEFLKKTENPIVGFCGSIKNNLGKRLSTIEAIKKSSKITSNFILRNEFWGGKPHDTNLKEEFKQNILDSHFNISNRGRGNFSMRFYQVMSLGRIPVLINSDMIFPFENEINWDDLIITGKNESELVNNIHTWWENKSDKEVIEVQRKCKQIFDDYFTHKNFSLRIETILWERLREFNTVSNLSFTEKIKAYFSFYKR